MCTFADDTTIFIRGTNIKFTKCKIKSDLKRISTYFKQHRLMLNIEKTNLMIFSKEEQNDFELVFEDTILKQCKSTKFLGVIIDNKLNWTEHGNSVLSKISSGLFSIKCVKKLIPKHVLENIYYANIQSYLQYAMCVWGPMLTAKISKKIKQKISIVRKLMPSTYNKKTLSFDDLQKIELAKLSFRYTNKMLPKRLENLFDMKHYAYNTQNANAPNIPIHGTKLYNSSYLCKSSSYWMSLPTELKDKRSIKSFTKHLKRRLLKN